VTLKAHEFDRIIEKYGFKTREGGDRLAWLEYEGRIVVRTKRSHTKGKDLPFSHLIRQQLHLSETQLGGAKSCTLGFDGYLTILRGKGVL
jgi:hypothetical protein